MAGTGLVAEKRVGHLMIFATQEVNQ